MRLITIGFGMAILLASAVSAAAPAPGQSGTKGDTGGKGGFGPENSTQSGAAGTQEETVAPDTSLSGLGLKSNPNPDQATGAVPEQKAWEVNAIWETHRLLEQQYIANSSSKTLNVLLLGFRYSLTDNDSLTLGGGASQTFLADPGEPGVRADDLSLVYTHLFQLPAKFRLSTSASITAPIGFYSQLASNITTPGVSLGISRRFGDLSLSAGWSGNFFWDRYTTASGIGCNAGSSTSSTCDEGSGSPNPKWGTGGYLAATYDMPFHRQLSVGVSVSDHYTWYYDVGAAPYGTTFYGATTNPTTDGQPFQQSYGGQVNVQYILPDLGGYRSDILLALANGDPSVGLPAVLHDGVVHPYLLGYNTAEVYFAYEARY
jgi:hypothetical protein